MQCDPILCEEFSSTHSWSCGDEKQAHTLTSRPRWAALGDAEFPVRRRRKIKRWGTLALVVLAECYWCFSVMLFLASSWLVTQRLVLTWEKAESEQISSLFPYPLHWNSTNLTQCWSSIREDRETSKILFSHSRLDIRHSLNNAVWRQDDNNRWHRFDLYSGN